MYKRCTHRQIRTHAFTLLELLTVVVLIAILSSIAVPAYNAYILRSRTAEAPLNIQSLVNAELTQIDKPQVDPSNGNERESCWITSSDRHPKPLAAVFVSEAVSWDSVAIPTGFQRLGFRPSGPVFYSYSLDNQNGLGAFNPPAGLAGYCNDGAPAPAGALTDQQLRVRAVGDLDGDVTNPEPGGSPAANVARYARIITMEAGIPTVGSLISTNEYE